MKYFFILYLSIFSFSAASSELSISYEEFVHLDFAKQEKTILMVHSFLIEYENQLRYGPIGKKKTVRYNRLKKIMTFFIAEAFGSSQALMDQIPSNLKCYFAGWMSFMKPGRDGKPYCIHPRRIMLKENQDFLAKQAGLGSSDNSDFKKHPFFKFYAETISEKYKAYFGGQAAGKTPTIDVLIGQDNKITLNESTKNCAAGSSISCNPEVYGEYKGKSLCIPSKGDYGFNASYLCSKAVEYIKETDSSEYKNLMTGIINKGIINNNSDLLPLLTTMYDTCLCGGDAKNSTPVYFQDSIDRIYADKIFKSRTCAGILNQTKLISETAINACLENPEQFSSPEQKKWLKFFSSANELLNDGFTDLNQAHAQLQSLNAQSLTPAQVEQLFASDNQLLGATAENNFNIASQNGLCPIREKTPALFAEYDEITKILTLRASGNEIDASDIQNMEIIPISVDGKEVAKFTYIDPDNPDTMRPAVADNVFQFSVQPAQFKSQAKASASQNGLSLESNIVDIPGLTQSGPKLLMSYDNGILTLKADGIPPGEESKFSISPPTISNEDSYWDGETKPDAPQEVQTTPVNPLLKTYNVTQARKVYSLKGQLLKENNIVDENSLTIPALNGDNLNLSLAMYTINGDKLYSGLDLKLNIAGQDEKNNLDIPQDKLTPVPESIPLVKLDETEQYFVAVPLEDTEYQLIYQKGGTPEVPSNKVQLAPPAIGCEIIHSNEEEKDYLTITAKLPEGITINNLEGDLSELISDAKMSYDGEELSAVEEKPLVFEIAEYDESKTAEATAKFKLANHSLELACNTGEVEEEAVTPEIAEEDEKKCKVKLSKKQLADGSGRYDIIGQVEFTDENGEKVDPPKGVEIFTYWFDNNQKPAPKEEAEEDDSASRAIAEDEPEESEGNDDDDDDDAEEEDEEKKSNLEILREKYRLVDASDKPESKITIRQAQVDRKITAYIKAGVQNEGEDKLSFECEGIATTTLERFYPKVPNSSPNFQNQNFGGMSGPRGTTRAGQR